MRVIACLNFSRSSALSMASLVAPIISHAVLLQHAVLGQIERAVERGLAAHGGQQRVGPLDGDDLLHHLPGDRLDVGGVRHLRVGHDGGRIGVHQDDAVALLAQRLAGLRAGVVELAGLADDDRAGADDQDALDVGALGHSERVYVPGPQRLCFGASSVDEPVEQITHVVRAGARLGWPWKQNAGLSVRSNALQRAVEQRHVGDAQRCPAASPASTAKPWFWLVIITRPVVQVLHRMVGAVMAELHLHASCAPLASASNWWPRQMPNIGMPSVEQLRGSPRSRNRTAPDRPGRWTGTRRRARAPAPLARSACAGTTVTRQPRVRQHAQDVALDAVVVGHHMALRRHPWLAVALAQRPLALVPV